MALLMVAATETEGVMSNTIFRVAIDLGLESAITIDEFDCEYTYWGDGYVGVGSGDGFAGDSGNGYGYGSVWEFGDGIGNIHGDGPCALLAQGDSSGDGESPEL